MMSDDFRSHGWLIGTICYVDQEKIRLRASVSDFSDRLSNGGLLHINGLNQYLYAHLDLSTRVVFRVSSVEEAERPYGTAPSDRSSESYVFTALPIGEMETNQYAPGVVDLPMVGSNVYACSERDLQTVFAVNGDAGVGNLAGYGSVRPRLDFDSLLTGHLAILGNTGSGKSTSARLLLSKIADLLGDKENIKPGALFVVFDLHGDYECLSRQFHQVVKRFGSVDYHLSPGRLSIDDWSAILDPSKRIQKPLLERAVKYASLSDEGKKKLYAAFAFSAIRDTSTDSHAARKTQIAKYYRVVADNLDEYLVECGCKDKEYQLKKNNKDTAKNANDLLRFFNLDFGNIPDGLTEDLEAVLRAYIGEPYFDEGLPEIDRIIEKNKKPEDAVEISDVVQALDFVFDEEEVRGNRQARSYSEGLVTQLNNLRDKYSDNLFSSSNGEDINDILKRGNEMIVLDVAQIVDETGLKLFSNYVARTLFLRNRQSTCYKDTPVFLVFDEAHRYIREADMTDDSIFNQIAREGRKFGVYLTVISQIPSELSKVVLSQTGAFIIHRIQNSNDLEYVRRNVPSITSSQVARLPSFAPGMATVLGSSLSVPFEVQVDDGYANETPAVSLRPERV